jgi:hypothetical protein
VSVLDDQWHHLAGVFTGSRFEIYLDGALSGTTTFGGSIANNTRDVNIGRSWGGGAATRYFRGLIDEVEFFNRALSSNEVSAIFNSGADGECKPCVTPPPGLVSWWPGDGHIRDIAGTNDGSLQNGTTFVAGMAGQAFSFDGANDVVSIADSPDLRFGPSSPMTVDMWVFRTSTSPRQHLIGKRAGCTGSSTEGTFQLHLNTTTPEGLGFANPGGSCACSGQDLPLNVWTHVAGTFDGSTLRLHMNGELAAMVSGSLGPANTAPLLLGGSGDCEHFGGFLDEVEVFSRALSASEIQAIYAASNTGKCKPCVAPPTGLVSWWPGDGNTSDIAGTNVSLLQGNATFGPAAVGQGFALDGIGDAASVGNPGSLQLQDFTINAWLKRTDVTQITHDAPNPAFPDGSIFSYGHLGYGFGLRQNGTACRLFLTKVDVSDVTSGDLEITDLNWHHVAVTKSGASVIFYLDGVAAAAPAYDPGFSFNTSAAIGARGDDLRNSLYATLDEIQIFNHALTAAEIQTVVTAGSLGLCKLPVLRITDIAREQDNIRVTWSSVGNTTNQLQAATGSITSIFTNLGAPFVIPGNGAVLMNSVDFGAITNAPARFYRIQRVP